MELFLVCSYLLGFGTFSCYYLCQQVFSRMLIIARKDTAETFEELGVFSLTLGWPVRWANPLNPVRGWVSGVFVFGKPPLNQTVNRA